jgi:hypothetical protein
MPLLLLPLLLLLLLPLLLLLSSSVLFGQGVHVSHTSNVVLCHSRIARLLLAYPP